MPHIHGRTYAELDDWSLPSRELKVFIEVTTARSGRRHLFDLDALRIFLSGRGTGCKVSLLTAGAAVDIRREFAGLSTPIQVVPDYVSTGTAGTVERVLGKQRNTLGQSYRTIELGREASADVVIPAIMPTELSAHFLRRELDMSVCDWFDAKRECEVFCRGNAVPWSFSILVWGMPFQGHYSFAERPIEILALRDAAAGANLEGDTIELLRSLALNRLPAVQFTRDQLLFHQQARRTARRNGFRRSEFQFELDYYLNHYYLLLWGGLDQMCWIMNGVLRLGIADHEHFKVGVGKEAFQSRVLASSSAVHEALVDPEFVAWRKAIAGARHHAAHRGITLASQLYFTDGKEPTVEELDVEIAADPEWMDLVGTLGGAMAEESRDLFRLKAKLRRLKEAPERVLQVRIDKAPALIAPLLNVEHDYEMFSRWSARVARGLTQQLTNTM